MNPTQPAHGGRQEPPEILALRRTKAEQPALGDAVDFQIAILMAQRRTQSRLTTPWYSLEDRWVAGQLAAGRPILQFDAVGFDWMELRLLFRQLTDILGRFDMLDRADHAMLLAFVRDNRPTPTEVGTWFDARLVRESRQWQEINGEAFATVLELAARPFVERAAATLRARVDLRGWAQAACPVCGSIPEMASLEASGERRLHCGLCATHWAFDAQTCPACGLCSAENQRSYGTGDQRYVILACQSCRRYLKAADIRHLERQIMLAVDSIATLPLDAAASAQGLTVCE